MYLGAGSPLSLELLFQLGDLLLQLLDLLVEGSNLALALLNLALQLLDLLVLPGIKNRKYCSDMVDYMNLCLSKETV